MAERGGGGRVTPTFASLSIITDGFGVFGSANFVITGGYSSAAPAGVQSIFGLEDGINSIVFGGMVVR